MWFEILNDSVLYYGVKNTVVLHGLTDTSGFSIGGPGLGTMVTEQNYVYKVIPHDFNIGEAVISVRRYGEKVPHMDTLPLKKIPNPIVSFQSTTKGVILKDSLVKVNKLSCGVEGLQIPVKCNVISFTCLLNSKGKVLKKSQTKELIFMVRAKKQELKVNDTLTVYHYIKPEWISNDVIFSKQVSELISKAKPNDVLTFTDIKVEMEDKTIRSIGDLVFTIK